MVIFHPQWQGNPNLDIKEGSTKLFEYFKNDVTHRVTTERHTMQTSKPILHYPAIHNHILRFSEILKKEKPTNIFVIGGDTTIDVIPITYLNMIHSNLKILWCAPTPSFDIPNIQPYNFTTVSSALLTGEGDSILRNYLFKPLSSKQFFNTDTLENWACNDDPIYIHIDLFFFAKRMDLLKQLSKFAQQNMIIGASISSLDNTIDIATVTPILECFSQIMRKN